MRTHAILERDEVATAWIYGSILTATAVAVSTTVKDSLSAGLVLLYTAATMVVVWLVHGYAAFVGHGGRVESPGLHHRLRHALAVELPVLASALPTLIAVAVCWLADARLGTTGLVGLAVAISTMVAVAARAARRSGAPTHGVAAAAAGALAIGGVIVAAKLALK